MTELLHVLVGCDRCGDVREGAKYARVGQQRLCVACWVKAGRPWPHAKTGERGVR